MTIPIFKKHLTMKHETQRGFTLVELMTVIAIVAVVAVWAIPSYSGYMARKRVDNAITQIVGSIKLARSQAMTTGRQINLCGLNEDRNACSATPKDWSSAWGMVISGSEGEKVLQMYEAPKMLQIIADDIVIAANGLRSGGGEIVIQVLPEGENSDGVGKKVTISSASLSYKIGNIE